LTMSLFDPHQRVDLQRQGDQQGREEQQAGAPTRPDAPRPRSGGPIRPARRWNWKRCALEEGSPCRRHLERGPGHATASWEPHDGHMEEIADGVQLCRPTSRPRMRASLFELSAAGYGPAGGLSLLGQATHLGSGSFGGASTPRRRT
jgi:hypothetical protein